MAMGLWKQSEMPTSCMKKVHGHTTIKFQFIFELLLPNEEYAVDLESYFH